MMTSSRLVRSTKGRLFAGLGVLTLFAGVIFLYHSTRVELDEVRNAHSKCRQEQDSLAAQVQVISEYKKNLEKSLNQEKAEHRQTKEELQSRMNDEQQLRDKENLENVNKYKALQQQYKLLQSEHEDLNELSNKAKAEQASCSEAVSRMSAQLASMRQEQLTKDTEASSLKLKFLRLEEENKALFEKLNLLQRKLDNNVNEQGANAGTKRGSTKETIPGESALGDNGTGSLHEPPHNVLPAAQKSSTAAQEEILQPARPAQPGLLQPVSKTSGNHSTTTQINPEALQSQDKMLHRALPALPMPLLLSPLQQHVSVEKQDFANNGPQGVLPAPLGFGSDNHYGQNAIPLQAPYRLHGLNHQEVLQNQGQMPPFAPRIPATGVQNNVLPAPPNHAHGIAQRSPSFGQALHQNMNPFQNDLSFMKQNLVDSPANAQDQHKYVQSDNGYLNGLKAHNSVYNLHKNIGIPVDNKYLAAQDVHKSVFLPHDNPFRADNKAAAFHKSAIKNVNIVPLDGDVHQQSDLEVQGGNPFVELAHHNQDSAHGRNHEQPAAQLDAQAGHYNYHGGDYDKEDPPANNEGEDEGDVDQIDYNNEPNQAHAPQQVLHPGHHAVPKMVHRRLADRHQDGVMVNPR
ncbi:Golgi integral membrane protein 4-like isoform X2 [Thrips palmi]|uniref:Golgi integral membrane protein 4-like isoform X2 n=1 Tax=Thrips palmi TaxID=161013 RepID=A0A6P9AHI1_THRPL|nr:Golgi integral membrane protein 4-like isoform X2 [Thrips palmi]